MMQYRVISADDHVQEPADTWQARVPVRHKDRAPKVVRTENGDTWLIDGKPLGAGIGLAVQAGRKFEEYSASGFSYDTIRQGSFDPSERLKDMTIDGVDAQVLFPNISLAAVFGIEDLQLQSACMRAYNDFLSDFCATDPRRLIGVPLIGTDNVEEAVGEMRRVARLPGLKGIILPTYPKGQPLNSRVYEPIWTAAEDLAMPVHLHLRTGANTNALTGSDRSAAAHLKNIATLANYEALSMLLFAGVCERHPNLKLVNVESSIGWIGYFLERSDSTYNRHRHWLKLDLAKPPSEYFHRQCYCTFIEDRVGIAIRHFIGVDNIMWSSDYPHSDTTWPESRKYIAEHFNGVPEDERHRIICGNAQKLYGLV
jgi:uncharacterized protein